MLNAAVIRPPDPQVNKLDDKTFQIGESQYGGDFRGFSFSPYNDQRLSCHLDNIRYLGRSYYPSELSIQRNGERFLIQFYPYDPKVMASVFTSLVVHSSAGTYGGHDRRFTDEDRDMILNAIRENGIEDRVARIGSLAVFLGINHKPAPIAIEAANLTLEYASRRQTPNIDPAIERIALPIAQFLAQFGLESQTFKYVLSQKLIAVKPLAGVLLGPIEEARNISAEIAGRVLIDTKIGEAGASFDFEQASKLFISTALNHPIIAAPIMSSIPRGQEFLKLICDLTDKLSVKDANAIPKLRASFAELADFFYEERPKEHKRAFGYPCQTMSQHPLLNKELS